MGWRPPSFIVRRELTYSQELLGQSRPNLLCSQCLWSKETESCARQSWGSGVEGVGLMYFMRNVLVCSGALSTYSGDG